MSYSLFTRGSMCYTVCHYAQHEPQVGAVCPVQCIPVEPTRWWPNSCKSWLATVMMQPVVAGLDETPVSTRMNVTLTHSGVCCASIT